MSEDQGTSKIQIDSDWKAEAAAEKAKGPAIARPNIVLPPGMKLS